MQILWKQRYGRTTMKLIAFISLCCISLFLISKAKYSVAVKARMKFCAEK